MADVIAKFYSDDGTIRVRVNEGKLECLGCKAPHCEHVVNVGRFLAGKIPTIPGNPKLYPETINYTAKAEVKARIGIVLKTVADKQAAAEAAAVAFAKAEDEAKGSVAGIGAALQAAAKAPQGAKVTAKANGSADVAKAMESAISQAVGGKAVQFVKESGEIVHSIPAKPQPAEKFEMAKMPLATPFRWIDMDADELAAARKAYEAEKAAQAKAKADAEAAIKAATEADKAKGEKPKEAPKPVPLIEID
jgi:hypothetical protein